ncbi:MAG: tetratricopeptide repeat protein [Pyrinomonadaceae bacterium]|nr:tetratricopeptide repeat protein [Pyrinomonadaceae bacterium]
MSKESTNKLAGTSGTAPAKSQIPRQQIGISDEEFMQMGQIGAMFYQQGKLEDAQTVFEGLVEIDPESGDAHAALGGLLTHLQNDEQALVHLNRAIELTPEQIAPWVNRAEVRIRQQQVEAALADLRQAIALDPEEADAGANRARAMVFGIHEALTARIEQEESKTATGAREANRVM